MSTKQQFPRSKSASSIVGEPPLIQVRGITKDIERMRAEERKKGRANPWRRFSLR